MSGRWVSVADRLPPRQGNYLVVRRDTLSISGKPTAPRIFVQEAAYGLVRNDNAPTEKGWRWEMRFHELGMLVPCTCWLSDVTHWMNLPNPPKRAQC